MVVNATLADAIECKLDCVEVARFAGALPGAPEKFQEHRLRKLGRAAGAAMDRVDDAAQLLRGAVELTASEHHPTLRPRLLCKARHQGRAVLLDCLRIVTEDARDIFKHIDEGRLAVAAGLGKVRTAPECDRKSTRL